MMLLHLSRVRLMPSHMPVHRLLPMRVMLHRVVMRMVDADLQLCLRSMRVTAVVGVTGVVVRLLCLILRAPAAGGSGVVAVVVVVAVAVSAAAADDGRGVRGGAAPLPGSLVHAMGGELPCGVGPR